MIGNVTLCMANNETLLVGDICVNKGFADDLGITLCYPRYRGRQVVMLYTTHFILVI